MFSAILKDKVLIGIAKQMDFQLISTTFTLSIVMLNVALLLKY